MIKKMHLILDDIKPISLNNCYVMSTVSGNIRRFPSKQYKQFETLVNLKLIKYSDEIKDFNSKFDKNKHYLQCIYIFNMPTMTKDMKVSQRSGDCSNLAKVLEDIIFKNLVADDSHITRLTIEKNHSEIISTEMFLSIHNL